jgi:hypothetical protein
MKRNLWLGMLVGLVGSLALLGWAGAAYAQGVKPPEKDNPDAAPTITGGGGPNALLGTTISYQGLIKINGVPYSGTCDLQFKLWNGDPASGGLLIATVGSLPALTSVSAGLFTTYIDFGDQFQGDYRQLEPLARCPSGSGVYQSLGVQVIYPAPYALALRPGSTIRGASPTGLTSISTAVQGTGLTGQADNGANAWGVAGFSNSGIAVFAGGGNNSSAPNTALKIFGGKLSVGGSITPAFVFTAGTVSGGCAAMGNPLLNNDPNAMIFITPRQTAATAPATDVKVLYTAPTWYLCSPSLAAGMTYNVLIINQ